MTFAPVFKMAREYPPAPKVPSITTSPGAGFSAASFSFNGGDGRCDDRYGGIDVFLFHLTQILSIELARPVFSLKSTTTPFIKQAVWASVNLVGM